MKATLIYEDELEQLFNDYLDDAYEPITLGFGKFYASDILKNCDPIAYRIGLGEFADNLVESADIYTKGYTDSDMPEDEEEEEE